MVNVSGVLNWNGNDSWPFEVVVLVPGRSNPLTTAHLVGVVKTSEIICKFINCVSVFNFELFYY